MLKNRKQAAKKEATGVVVDYPQADECIAHPSYTFRIGAKGAEQVEVSINGSLWQPCRLAVGYWWYDWRDYLPGRHQVVARMVRNGETQVTTPCCFRVDFGKKKKQHKKSSSAVGTVGAQTAPEAAKDKIHRLLP